MTICLFILNMIIYEIMFLDYISALDLICNANIIYLNKLKLKYFPSDYLV